MTKIHVVTRHNRTLYDEAIRHHHQLRHDIFVGERSWRSLTRSDCRDIDAYDNDNTTYLLAIDNDRVVGGQRLYPTVLPHMISDVFPHLVSMRSVPKAPDIFEWTRYFVVKERRTGRTDCRMLAAVQEFCLEEGISQVTAVVEMWWLPRWQQSRFKVRPLGLPVDVEGQPTIAVLIDISEESLAAVRCLAGLRGASLVRRGPQRPAIHWVPYATAS
ncbi:acyl-homoserine-lactone synthase [Methylobacterium sp. SyP6R]|uniref:acyl-homoserine-lactone synthase n=1 Tax=Methylobacterium sp. SyP6R TaxID=2718876 RepID=UPI001F2A83B5|nr:acyl-homoserine-lactone synthase [Methylobacterium sp. SyP6R]MCF4130077.1 GNAT family N-acetyltransferase [Methylobacterium sp. SyP6R]